MRHWTSGFHVDGAGRRHALFDDAAIAELSSLFAAMPPKRPGRRVAPSVVTALACTEKVRDEVVAILGSGARIVRAVLFDKNDGANWALGWHQDRVIEVAGRRDLEGFGPWTVKQGRLCVMPPQRLLDSMMTVRIHLDAVDAENAPLLVAPGSHRLGLVAESRIEAAVAKHGVVACLADAGDAWFYATPILHASARAVPGRRRRVIQLDFSADALPGGLEWADAA